MDRWEWKQDELLEQKNEQQLKINIKTKFEIYHDELFHLYFQYCF